MLGTDASEEQIQLAYEMMCELPPEQMGSNRSRIERAYSVLIDSKSRAAYDRRECAPLRPQRKRLSLKLDDWRILAACAVLLTAILVFVWVPLYGSRFRSFSAGDDLLDLDGHPFGTILQSDEKHLFPGGVAATAYLVELKSSKETRWFPQADLQASCRRAR